MFGYGRLDDAIECHAHRICDNDAYISSFGTACPTFQGDIAFAFPDEDLSAGDRRNLTGLAYLYGSLLVDVGNTPWLRLIANDLYHVQGSLIINFTSRNASNFELESLSFASAIELVGQGIRYANPETPEPPGFDGLLPNSEGTSMRVENSTVSRVINTNQLILNEVLFINNLNLQEVSLSAVRMNGNFVIEALGGETVVRFPLLDTALNMTIANCLGVVLPSLKQVNGSLELHHNAMTDFDSPLRTIDGNLMVEGNANLTGFVLASLQAVGGDLRIVNNTKLTSLDSLYTLGRVNGSIEISGNISSVSITELSYLGGAFTLNSTGDMACDGLNNLYTDGVIGGEYSCRTANDFADAALLSERASSDNDNSDGGSVSPDNDSDESNNSSNDNSTALGAGLGVGIACFIALLAALYFFFWWRPRRQKRKRPQSPQAVLAEKDGEGLDRAAMLGDDGQRHEMAQLPEEAPLGNEAQELPAKHGQVELGRGAPAKSPEVVEERHEMPANEAVERREENGREDYR
ncbi:hypothetical protein MBLNU230_g1975t1 [Neophaeotheca triangularis]